MGLLDDSVAASAAAGAAPHRTGSDGAASDPPQQPQPQPPASVSVSVQALVEAVVVVGAVAPVELPGPVAVAEAQVLLAQLEVLRAVVLTRIADVDARRLHTLVDAPTTGTWLGAQHTSVTRTEVGLARRLSAFTHLAGAVRSRQLSVAAAARLAGALVRLRRHLDRPDGLIDGQPAEPVLTAVIVDGVLDLLCQARGGLADTDPLLHLLHAQLRAIAAAPQGELARLEQALVLLAEHLQPAALPSALALLVDALLPTALEDRARDGHDQRGLTLRRHDDGSGWTISRGQLDPECGELLHTLLTAELAVDPDNPTDTAAYSTARQTGWRPGLDELPEAGGHDRQDRPGPRSLAQRRHDALRNGLRRYLDSGLTGTRDKSAPHLSVTVSLPALHGAPGALPPVAASGAHLPLSLIRAWQCDSRLTRFVLSLGRKVLETSHTQRTLKAAERRAKRLETGGQCQTAGCPPARSDQRLVPHHPTPWAQSNTTSLADTVLLCEHDHHHLHHGHTLRLKDGRRLGPHGWLDGLPSTSAGP